MGQLSVRWGGVSHAGVGWGLNELFLQFTLNLLQLTEIQNNNL